MASDTGGCDVGALAGEAVTLVSDGVSKWTVQTSDTPSGVLATTYAALGLLGEETYKTTRSATLRPFHAALAGRYATPCNIAIVGDSISEGTGVTALADRYVSRFRDLARSRWPVSGLTGGEGYLPVQTASTTLTNSFTGNTTPLDVTFGLGLRCTILTTGKSVSLTVTGTSVDLLYARGSSTGTFSWAVDGGSATNVATSNGSTIDTGKTSVTLGSAGSHTVVVTWVSGGSVFFEGAVVYNGDETKGIRTFDCSHHGYKAGDFTASSWFEKQLGNFQPSLVVLALTVNDYGLGTAVATHKTNLQTIISRIKAVCSIAPSFVLVGMYERSASGSQIATYDNYVNNLYSIAAADTACCVLDLTKRMTITTTNPLGLYDADTVHPTAKGHGYIADALVQFISP